MSTFGFWLNPENLMAISDLQKQSSKIGNGYPKFSIYCESHEELVFQRGVLEYPQLPEWAIGFAKGNYKTLGAQLCTRDGRKMGNAFIMSIDDNYHVMTDMGNVLVLTENEIKELFYPPKYYMDIVEATASRIAGNDIN